MNEKENFYVKLKERLSQTTEFPTIYLYKFIVPTDGNQVDEIKEVFKDKSIEFTTKNSKTGKYISISVRVNLSSPDEVISYYKMAEKIKGIISL